jgi:glyoxylase-like metal-dependent hydrolase (beta-lactamase superfamily II)
MRASTLLLALSLGLAATPAPAAAQNPEVTIQTIPLRGSVSMLVGSGGNIGVSAGPDGVFMIDDQFAPLSARIQAALAALSPRPVRFLVNTHWHGDHTGGNENFGAAGAVIVAHDNVRRRMSTEQFIEAFKSRTPPAPAAALPVVTFDDRISLHWNGEEIRAFHVRNAHTDGDAIIQFTSANVIHMGDTFFNGIYPFIDGSTGGSVAGMIAAADQVLALANDDTKIIPGHGPLASRADLASYRRMLSAVSSRISALIRQKQTLDQVVAAKPTAEFDAVWGKGFLNPDAFVAILYNVLSKGAS